MSTDGEDCSKDCPILKICHESIAELQTALKARDKDVAQLKEALEKIIKQEIYLAKAMGEIAVTDETKKYWEEMESANTKIARQALESEVK